MSDLEKLIIDKIDNMRDEIIKFLQEIVRIPSENPPSKYKEVARFVERKMGDIGLKTSIKRNNVIGELENGDGPTLIFNGHFDVWMIVIAWRRCWRASRCSTTRSIRGCPSRATWPVPRVTTREARTVASGTSRTKTKGCVTRSF